MLNLRHLVQSARREKAGWQGCRYRQVAFDKGGLAHAAISDQEKLELGDLLGL